MQDLTDHERKQVLGEILMDELKAIRERISGLPTRQEFKKLEGKVDDLASDMKIVKKVLKDKSRQQHDHQKQLQDHERRLTPIERAA